MKITAFRVVFIILLLIPAFAHPGYARKKPAQKSSQEFSIFERWFAWGDKWLYMRAIDSAKAGAAHFAFMDFTRVCQEYPESKFADDALFASGEYYLRIGDSYDAFCAFNSLANDYPKSEIKLFALAYILKIAGTKARADLIKDLEKRIIAAQQASLLFRDFKEYEYLSPFSGNYKAICFINRIEFYIDGELFAKVSF